MSDDPASSSFGASSSSKTSPEEVPLTVRRRRPSNPPPSHAHHNRTTSNGMPIDPSSFNSDLILSYLKSKLPTLASLAVGVLVGLFCASMLSGGGVSLPIYLSPFSRF